MAYTGAVNSQLMGASSTWREKNASCLGLSIENLKMTVGSLPGFKTDFHLGKIDRIFGDRELDIAIVCIDTTSQYRLVSLNHGTCLKLAIDIGCYRFIECNNQYT